MTPLWLFLLSAAPLWGGEVERPASMNLQAGGWIDPNTVECSGTRCRAYVTADTWFTLESEEICSYFGGDCRTLVRWVDEKAWESPDSPGASVLSEDPEPPAGPPEAVPAAEKPAEPAPVADASATATQPPATDDAAGSDTTAPTASRTASESPSASKPTESSSPEKSPAGPPASQTPSPRDVVRRAFEEGLGRLQREAGRLEGGLELRPGAHGIGTAGVAGEERVSGAFLDWQERAERLLADPATPPEALAASLGELSRLAEQGLGESAKPFQESIRRMIGEMAAALEVATGTGSGVSAEDGPWSSLSAGERGSDSSFGTRPRRVPAAYGEGADTTSPDGGSLSAAGGGSDPTAESVNRKKDGSRRRASPSVASLLGAGLRVAGGTGVRGGTTSAAGKPERKRRSRRLASESGALEGHPYSDGLLASLLGHRGSAAFGFTGAAAAAGLFLLLFWRRRRRRR